jgi:subtilisin family serine protease
MPSLKKRSSNNRPGLIGLLSISTALALVVVAAATTASHAQFRPSSMSVGPRSGGMGNMGGSMGNSGFRSEPRFQRFQNSIVNNPKINNPTLGGTRYPGKGKGKGDDVVVNNPGGDGRPGRRPPGKRPPWVGPGIGPIVGPAVVTGVAVANPGPAGAGPTGPLPPRTGGTTVAQRGRVTIPPPNENRFVKDEVLIEVAGQISPQVTNAIAARNGLTRIESFYTPLTNSTMFRWKINNGRPVRMVLAQLGNERVLDAIQPNFIYQGSQTAGQGAGAATGGTFAPQPQATPQPIPAVATAAARPAAGDPAQYALAKLRIGEAHGLANGDKILVAVIDSGVDLGHPEFKGAVAGSFDALGKNERPHSHGTAIAGAIAARARLMGAAPAARILAIRAFGASGTSTDATTMAIVKGIKYATEQKARVINMSFAGPTDPGLGRYLAAAKANGAVLIAAAGNFGPKSPPQYPAADPNVIAVSATDSNDHMFRASNIGTHVAVAAPGVDILLPAPDNDYQLISGTSFSAAYVSGVVALMLQRAPQLTADGVRKILQETAKDLGPTGKDAEFGAGLVDAYQAILAAQPSASAGPGAPPQPQLRPQVTTQ